MDEVFYKLSKIIIFLPIAVVIIALVIKFNQKQNFLTKEKYNNYQIRITPSLFLSKIPSKKPEKIGINLNDHWICEYKFDSQKYKLEINKRKINLEVIENGKVQRYDLSFYAGIIENYLNMDINQLEEMAKFYLPKNTSFKDLVKSCKKIQ